MTTSVLVFLIKDNKVCLGRRKKKYAFGKWNGFGGKVEKNESVIQAAVRELLEESSIATSEEFLEKVAEIYYHEPWGDWLVHTFTCKDFAGEPTESDEMQPKWFDADKLPFDEMWDNDKIWLVKVISERKKIKGEVWIGEDERMIKYELNEIKGFN